MKTTLDLPDELLMEAKKYAVEKRTTLKALVEEGLRQRLGAGEQQPATRKRIRWVVTAGGVPPGMDISSRKSMMEHLLRDRS